MLNQTMQNTIDRAEAALSDARDGRHVDMSGFDRDVEEICALAKTADMADRVTAALGLRRLDEILGELEYALRISAGESRFTAGR